MTEENLNLPVDPVEVETWEQSFQPTGSGNGVIAAMFYKRGGQNKAKSFMVGSFTPPTIGTGYKIDGILAYDIVKTAFSELIAKSKAYNVTDDKTGLLADQMKAPTTDGDSMPSTEKELRTIKLLRNMSRSRQAYDRLLDEIVGLIGKKKNYNWGLDLMIPWHKIVACFSNLLIESRFWKDGENFSLKFYWPLFTNSKKKFDTAGKLLPSNYIITVNDQNKVRYERVDFEPMLQTITGLRIKLQFLEIVEELFDLPGGFLGHWEWLTMIDEISPLANELCAVQNASATDNSQKWLYALVKLVGIAWRRIMVLGDPTDKNVGTIMTKVLLMGAAVVAMENKTWKGTLEKSQTALTSKECRIVINYMQTAETDAIAAWMTYAPVKLDYMGYPVKGTDWFAGFDFGEDIDCIRFLGIKYSELTTYPVKIDDYTLAIKTKPTWMTSGANKWYELGGATIYRDGTIEPTIKDKACVFFVTAIDNWFRLYLKEEPFSVPETKLVILGVTNGWKDILTKWGLNKVIAGAGWGLTFGGKAMPVLPSDYKNYGYLEYVHLTESEQKIADTKILAEYEKIVAEEKLKAEIAAKKLEEDEKLRLAKIAKEEKDKQVEADKLEKAKQAEAAKLEKEKKKAEKGG